MATSVCPKLRELFITTQICICYPGLPSEVLHWDDFVQVAKAAWAPRMEFLRIRVRYVSLAGYYEICEENLYASKKGEEISLLREDETKAEEQLLKWSKTLGCPVRRYEDLCKQRSYLEHLRSKIERMGRTALANIAIQTAPESRPRRIRRSARANPE